MTFNDIVQGLMKIGGGTPVAAPQINGSSVGGYSGLDLSNFTPGTGKLPTVNPVTDLSGVSGASTDPTFWQSMTGYKDPTSGQAVNGWGGLALSAGQGIFGAINGMKQFGLMEDQLKEQKRQFDLNYSGQKKAFNSQLEDRQRARVASNPGAYQSVGDYMNKYAM